VSQRHPLARGLRLGAIVGALLVLGWLTSGVRVVRTGEQAVMLAWGQVQEVRSTPGLLLCLPRPFAEIMVLPGPDRQLTLEIHDMVEDGQSRRGRLLTADGALIQAQATIVYSLHDPKLYALRVADVDQGLRRAGCAALIAETAGTPLVGLVTGDPQAFRVRLAGRIQGWLDQGLPLGVTVRRVDLTVLPPLAAKAAFAAVQDAAAEGSRSLAEAENRAAWVRSRARIDADALVQAAAAAAAERLATQRTALAPVTALQEVIAGGRPRAEVLEAHWRQQCALLLQRVQRLVVIPAGESARLGVVAP
jgi:regulator of protease activity HflC (stomatin/prohibitin superfamily)